ncbi:tetratricopeptide repeat protein, partial [Actinomadura adrarensis]
GEASALECLGVARLGMNDAAGAIDAFDRAREIHREIGLERGVAMMTRRLGEALALDGRIAEAIDHFSEALAFFDDRGDDYNRARILMGLAGALVKEDRPREAGERLETALEAATRAGALQEQGNAHLALARLAQRAGDPTSERTHLEEAHAVFEELGSPQAAETQARLAELGPDEAPGQS